MVGIGDGWGKSGCLGVFLMVIVGVHLNIISENGRAIATVVYSEMEVKNVKSAKSMKDHIEQSQITFLLNGVG